MVAVSLDDFPELVSLLLGHRGGPLVLIVPKPMPVMKMAMTKPLREALGCRKVGRIAIPVRVTWLAPGEKLV